MVSNEVYEQEVEKIGPKLENLKNRSFDEIMKGLYDEILQSSIPWALIFALTYILDPSRFYIKVEPNLNTYSVGFAADTPLRDPESFVYRNTLFPRRPTEKEARDRIKKFLTERIKVEGLLKKAEEVVDTCKVIQGP